MSTSLRASDVLFNDSSTQSTASKVGQVVGATVTATIAVNTASTWTDLAGMSVTITPKSTSSKILVMYSTHLSGSSNAQGTITNKVTRILRNGSVIGAANARGASICGASAGAPTFDATTGSTHMNMFLDSPSTTSAVTYKIQLYSEGAANIAGGTYNTNYLSYTIGLCSPSTITVIEVLP